MGAKDQGLAQSKKRYLIIPRVLIFITNQNDVLLLKGSPHKRIWPNLYNGIGGHIERGETVLEAALREINEEVGLNNIRDLRLRGIITIDAQDPTTGIMLFVLTAISPSRDVKPSEEGTLEWVNWHDLPVEALVEDLPTLLPRVLMSGTDKSPFFARYWHDETDSLQMTFIPEKQS